jgi:hypothetical protein
MHHRHGRPGSKPEIVETYVGQALTLFGGDATA